MANRKKRQPAKTVAPKKIEKKKETEEQVVVDEKVEREVAQAKADVKSKKTTVSPKQQEKEKRTKKARRKTFIHSTLVTILVTAFVIASLYPILKATKFGLDLQGGFEIVYKITKENGEEAKKADIEATQVILERRINSLGVAEPEIIEEGSNLRIQLPGVEDEETAKNTLGQVAQLTFRNIKDEKILDADVLEPNSVRVATNPDKPGTYMLTIGIKDIEKFYTETKKLYDAGTPMVAWLDFEEGVDSYTDASIPDHCGAGSNTHCISIAYINGELTGDSVQLTGNFTQQEAEDLANLLNSGSLPTKMEEISSRTVDPTFGEDALHKTFLAGVVGIIIIILFLTAVYRFSGVITGVGILIYTALVFLIFNLLGARLTLPSIAAVVIGIGMAVDACIISFSRIKEELREKKTLEEAFKKGNKNSLSSILDANITTLIAAVILFNKGTGSVKGFATMLIISIFVTLFVMVYLMRILLGMFVKSGIFEGHYRAFLGMKSLEKKDTSKVNLAKWMPRLFTATVVILVVGGICSYFRGFHMGIDFQGGSSITIQSTDTLEAVKLEKDLTELQYDVARVEIFNDDHSAYITLSDFVDKDDEVEIKKVFAKYSDVATDISAISNLEKEKLIRNAIESLIYACLGLILYVTLRFTFSYGISAVCALIHDVAIVIIAFSLFHLEVSSIFVAAILSIIGYSINDTIVAFDRIRENKKKLYHNQIKTKEELKELVQVTLKEVIGRSLLTSITTLIPVIALIFLGSREILTFNYALLIGLIAGTYSSLFVALQLWYILERKNVGKKEKKKWYEVDDKDDVEELKVKGINC